MLAAPVGAAAAVLEGEVRPVESEAAPLPARVPVGAELEAARLPVLEALRRDDARCCADERPAVEPPLAQLCERAQKTRAISTERGTREKRAVCPSSRVVESGDAVLLKVADALQRIQAVVAGIQLGRGGRVGADALFGSVGSPGQLAGVYGGV